MHSFPTLEPVIVHDGSFLLHRFLDRDGEIDVVVGDTVAPESIIGRSENVEEPVKIYVANELAVEHGNLKKYLSKSIGASVVQGSVIARVRRGLRTVTVRAPVDGVLVNVDDSNGTVTLSSSVGFQALRSLVYGTVQQVFDSRGAILKASGDRYYGIVGFGGEAIGELVAGADRHDREFTSDLVETDWSGKIVLAGMTLGVAALQALAAAEVAGVIVGSIAETDIRRFVTPAELSEPVPASEFWQSVWSSHHHFSSSSFTTPFVVVVTEGFGRQPMAAPLFESLKRHEGDCLSINAATELDDRLSRPEIYVTRSGNHATKRKSDAIDVDRTVRVNDPSHIGAIGTTATDMFARTRTDGRVTMSALVTTPSGESRIVPVDNLEVIT